jgi:aromatic-amino-acid transaminase
MLHVIPSHQARPADDPIFALNSEATARKGRGESIVNATVGSLLDDYGKLAVLPTAAEIVHDVPAEEWAAYAPIAGSPAFLRGVLDDLFASEPEMRAAAVAVATPGGSGALRHAIANFLEPGHSILTTSFYWGPYQTLADEADRRVATFPMFRDGTSKATDSKGGSAGVLSARLPSPERGSHEGVGTLDLEGLDRALATQIAAQKRVLLILNDPCHNPTGYSMRTDEWRGVVERLSSHAARAPITLLVDTAYFMYAAAKDPRAFLAELRPLVGKVCLLFAWSASKTFTHYGLRVGALVAVLADAKERAQTEAALVYSSRGTWSNCTRGGQSAIARLLTDPKLRDACDRERAQLTSLLARRVAAFNAHAPKRGLRYPRYEGGFFVTVFHEDALAKAATMKDKGVFVVPSKGALRVALCSVAERDIPRLVEAFD